MKNVILFATMIFTLCFFNSCQKEAIESPAQPNTPEVPTNGPTNGSTVELNALIIINDQGEADFKDGDNVSVTVGVDNPSRVAGIDLMMINADSSKTLIRTERNAPYEWGMQVTDQDVLLNDVFGSIELEIIATLTDGTRKSLMSVLVQMENTNPADDLIVNALITNEDGAELITQGDDVHVAVDVNLPELVTGVNLYKVKDDGVLELINVDRTLPFTFTDLVELNSIKENMTLRILIDMNGDQLVLEDITIEVNAIGRLVIQDVFGGTTLEEGEAAFLQVSIDRHREVESITYIVMDPFLDVTHATRFDFPYFYDGSDGQGDTNIISDLAKGPYSINVNVNMKNGEEFTFREVLTVN